jgi:membrane-associated phospholipid phosphatase
MSSSLFVSLEPIVTWIKVEKPSFDLVGVVLSSFRLAGILLVLALVLGLLLEPPCCAPAAAPARPRSRPSCPSRHSA